MSAISVYTYTIFLSRFHFHNVMCSILNRDPHTSIMVPNPLENLEHTFFPHRPINRNFDHVPNHF